MPRRKTTTAAAANENEAIKEIAQKNTAMEKAKTEKMTGRGGKYNFPSTVPPEKPEDVQRVLSEVLHWYGNKPAKTDAEIEERINSFFGYCAERGERPTVEKLALALGVSRRTLWSWKTEIRGSAERSELIQYAYEVLAAYDAGMAIENKLPVIPYVFRAKNYYEMKDSTDIVVTPNNPLGDKEDPDVIAAKYQELPDE